MKRVLLPLAILFVLSVLATAWGETVKTRLGDLEFTHDFANGYPTDQTVRKLHDEIDFHLEMRAEELEQSGMSPEAARREAAITRSGHGGASSSERARSTLRREVPSSRLGSRFQALW